MTTPNEELLARAKRLRNELDDSNARLDRLCVTAMYEMEQALKAQTNRIKTLETECEVERLRLAACGVAALGYFDGCKDEYKSASLDDVLRLNKRCTDLRAELDSLAANAIVAAADSQKACMKLLDEDLALRAELADMAVNAATYEHLVDLANGTATRLLKERDTLRAQLVDAELHTKQVERGLDKATAQLAAIAATEPVAWLYTAHDGSVQAFTNEPPQRLKELCKPVFNRAISPVRREPMSDGALIDAVANSIAEATRPMPAQGVTELVEAFEYHIEQTRPIERSTIALSKYKGAK